MYNKSWDLYRKRLKKYYLIYIFIAPCLLFFIIFHYIPMFGLIIAFQDYSPFDGFINSKWVGFKNFERFSSNYYFVRVLVNTLNISIKKLLFGMPSAVIFALLLNELKNKTFMKLTQSISYLPYFVSWIVAAGLFNVVLSPQTGIINQLTSALSGQNIYYMGDSRYFVGVLIATDIWKNLGWQAIIYIAVLSSVSPTLYEAAKIDGAGRFLQARYISLPALGNIFVILFILNCGYLLSAGFEQVFSMYSPSVYEVADIIDTYVYREGIENVQYSFSTAVGFFKSIVGLILIIFTNQLAKKVGYDALW